MTVSDDMFISFVALPRALLRQQFDQSIRNLEKSDGIQHIPIKLIEKHTTPKFTESWEIRQIKSNNICGLFGRWRNPKKKHGKTKTKKGNLSRLLGGGRVQARFPEHCLCWFSMGMPFFSKGRMVFLFLEVVFYSKQGVHPSVHRNKNCPIFFKEETCKRHVVLSSQNAMAS